MNLVTRRGEPYEYLETESGRKLFSVTQIRRMAFDSYRGIDPQVLEAARQRGTLVHRYLWRYLAYRTRIMVDIAPLPGIEGYCQSIREWADKHEVTAVRLEHRSLNRKLGYAGTVDAQILYGPKAVLTLMDGKSGVRTCTDMIQLLAYDAMDDLKSKQLMDVYFQADGGPAKEIMVTARDRITQWPVFLNVLSLLRWRTTNDLR